jgi:Zn-dependent metalloprotease
MKLPINLDSLLKPLSVFLLTALLVTGAIYGILHDEQRAKEASNLQKEILAAIPSSSMSNNREVTWTEAGKQLLALEEKRETVTQLFQENFKKTDTKTEPTKSTENQNLQSFKVKNLSVQVITDPTDVSKKTTPSLAVTPHKNTTKKIKKRKSPACCHCRAQRIKHKKNALSCR